MVTREVTKNMVELLAQHGLHSQTHAQSALLVSAPSPGNVSQELSSPVVEDAISSVCASLISSVCASLTGEIGSAQQPTRWFNSISLPLDARIPTKIIDFGLLLFNHLDNQNYRLCVSQANSPGSPELSLEPTSKTFKITNIDTWLKAFHIFVAINLFPEIPRI